ncbi:MAG: NAD(P)/FAD-dependent oxidoreductase, partial [Gammaproteobacteria bacterium]|nr:NAD(P)/FAD-dependent oxidoreductase [Gammaproteobacteria bacterium]
MNNENKNHYDLIIIGSGPAGYKAAVAASMHGVKVAMIEKAIPGGTCLNEGCVPKDAIVRIAKLLRDFSNYSGHGIIGEIKGDFVGALKHKTEVIEGIRSTLLPWLRQLGIRLHQGNASFVDQKTIKVIDGVTENLFTAEKILIATGAKAKPHPICKHDGIHVLDSSDFMYKLTALPETMLIVGGGPIGCELAYALHQFGTKVTLLEKTDRLLNKNGINERASRTLERKFKQLGIRVLLNDDIVSCIIENDRVNIDTISGETLNVEKALVAIGRQPYHEGLELQNAAIKTDSNGFIVTNEYLETTTRGIYAIGDVKPGPMTANAAFHDAKIAASNAIDGNKLTHNYNRVPILIDTALQIASVGLTEERAESAGFEPEVARANLAASTKAKTNNDPEGYIEVVHDEETGQLLGGTIVGRQASEMIHTLTAACQSERGLWFFTDMSYSHPSWNEELEN